MLPKLLAVSALAWPLLLGSAVVARQGTLRPIWTTVVYASASRICHQRPERSFFTGAVQWPVCARCSGLYLSAPIGALAALRFGRRIGSRARARIVVAAASVPTVVTLAVEWLGLAAPSNIVRAIAAVPLGVAIAFVLVRVARQTPKAIE